MKVLELEGAQLDYWVALAEGLEAMIAVSAEPKAISICLTPQPYGRERYRPSTDWAKGGPIIEREGISLLQVGQGDSAAKWSANFETWYEDRDDPWTGPTPLIAAMRAFVASKYGEEVPDEG